ncbi:MAG: tRNA lysidine(34) synthetase TilS [Steroidobacteraceae bacterium]|nr:tRNA lysidine(34) synthetase TilS [Steroidobacteraceae bacterium]MBP7014663.1 tRNA lysidine(34) synthetase TilS [Steroidobacteraceae bacterium]
MFSLHRLATSLDLVLAPATAASHGKSAGLCIALSGGLDSTVLLVALAQLANAGSLAARLRAIHVDHALHADSVQWARACRELADSHGVACDEVRVAVNMDGGQSPEAAARKARYTALAARLEPGEVLLTAHHADDQLETILLQWLRGGGLRSIAGMAPLGRFGAAAWHARPLLEFTRDELAAWAGKQGLCWQEDPSNLDRRFDRNYLRLEVLPALRQRWPAVAATAGRVARYACDALAAEAACVADDLPRVLAGTAIELGALQALPEPRRRAVLRAWLAGLGLPPAPARSLAALLRDMTVAAADRIPETRWPGVVVRRYRGRLHVEATGVDRPNEGSWQTSAGETCAWSAGSTIALSPDVGTGLSRERLPARIEVRRRTGGEAFLPAGSAHHRPLRKWLQEHDVLPWRRENLPLLFAGNRLIAVADLGVAAEFAARADEPSWRIVWNRRGALTEADVLSSKWPAHPPIR